MKNRILAATAVMVASITTSDAAPIGFGFNAGPVISVHDTDGKELSGQDLSDALAVFGGLQIGENVFVDFTIDDATPDSDAPLNNGSFEDPAGTITVSGLTSGAMLSFVGVELQLDDEGEFELEQLTNLNFDDSDDGIFFSGDTDLNTQTGSGSGEDIVSNPDDLAQSISELESLLFGGNFSGITNGTGNQASLSYFVGGDGIDGANLNLTFGPVPTVAAPSAIPLPASTLLLLTGLSGLGAMRMRRKAA